MRAPRPVLRDALQLVQTTDVHQAGRLGQAEFHDGQETVPAGDDLGSAAGSEGTQRVLERAGANVIEAGGNHLTTLPSPRSLARGRLFPPVPSFPLAWRAAHTRAGVSGLSMCRIPKGCERVADRADQDRRGEAMVPASPQPLTPSGFTGDGVTV